MRDWLYETSLTYPDRPALLFKRRLLTYRELNAEADRAALWLRSRGVLPGAIIGIYCAPSVETVALIHAVMRIGATLLLLNLRLSRDELAPQVILAWAVVADVRLEEPVHHNWFVLHDYTKFEINDELVSQEFELENPHSLIFTSGTSGRAKPAELTYGNHYYSAQASAERIGVFSGDRWLCCMPLYHVGGLAILLRCAIGGMCVVLHKSFNVENVNRALDEDGVTLVSLVPTMLYRLLEARSAPPAHLRLCLLGGAAATQDLVQRAQTAGFPVATTYGLTESASQVVTQTPEQTLLKPGSVGKAITPYSEVCIESEAGEQLATGDIGEVIVRGKTVMRGYFGEPEATANTLRSGALHTGDLGFIDADGDLWIVQRRSDLIVSGGENVYPAEIEAALRTHPMVEDACVVGIPHPEWGQQVAALVVVHEPLTAEALITSLRQTLAGYKIPRMIRFTNMLPTTANGKIARNTIRDIMSDIR